MSDDKAELRSYLDSHYPDIKDEMTVLSKEEVPFQTLMHISKNTAIESFKPFVSVRVAEATDKRVPRICTASSLAGCFLGYYGDWWDFEVGTEEDEGFLGGYVIYGFDFEAAVLPSTKLVSDVECSNEMWLVTYNESTAEYKPKQLGKVFHMQIALNRVEGEVPTLRRDITTFVEVYEGCTIPWNNTTTLEPGFYRIYTIGLMHSQAWDKLNQHSVENLSKEEYLKGKELTASLLGLVELPCSARW